MYKTIWKGETVSGTYAELTDLVKGYIGNEFIRVS